jgi:alpha-glucosidase (family GH31 glycosyl hydrolase)
MLKHLIPQIEPVADPKNVILFEDFRITVLDRGLFRIERDPKLQFNDCATQSVWFRNMPPQKYTTARKDTEIHIATEAATLIVAHKFEQSRIIIKGKELPLENAENLLGTYRTLDCYDGEYYIRNGSRLKLERGVCSKNGVALIDDSASLRLDSNGSLIPAADQLLDLYVFAYGKDYRNAVRAIYSICGSVPMLPRFAFGNWWSRYHAYTDKEYLHLIDQFEKEQIPLTVATLDMDWHYSSNVDEEKQITAQGKNTLDRGCLVTPENKNIGWTGYSWNQNLFPDYRAFLRELKSRDLKVTLNLHPSSGIRYYEDMYVDMAEAMGVDPSTEKTVEFNISDEKFVKEYFRVLHHPYERDGVDFWWIDWQQGTKSEMDGLDPLWALNHYHYLDNGKDHAHPLIVSRYAGIGSHRYPIGFSGDTTISWETLRLMPYFTATASNIGYTWWGHDIGGHHLGIKDDELYLRFLQFGVFNPINRMHCTDSPILTKEPWAYENGIGELAKKMLVLRHRLIPFLYSCNYLTHTEGLALCEPLYYQYPDAPESYTFKNEYLFGQSLLVAPVTDHSKENGLSEVALWLPEGVWTDFFTGDVYRVGKGGHVITAVRPLDSIPVFAKEGSVVVLSNDRGNGCDNPREMEARIYNGNGEYSLFEDRGDATAFTKFQLTKTENTQTVTLSVVGDVSVIPEGRTVTLSFPNIVIHHSADAAIDLNLPTPEITVLKNGKPCEAKISAYEEVSITLKHFDPNAVYEIRVTVPPLDLYHEVLRSVIHRLQKLQAPFSVREKILKLLKKKKPLDIIKGYIYMSDISDIYKKRLTETILEN